MFKEFETLPPPSSWPSPSPSSSSWWPSASPSPSSSHAHYHLHRHIPAVTTNTISTINVMVIVAVIIWMLEQEHWFLHPFYPVGSLSQLMTAFSWCLQTKCPKLLFLPLHNHVSSPTKSHSQTSMTTAQSPHRYLCPKPWQWCLCFYDFFPTIQHGLRKLIRLFCILVVLVVCDSDENSSRYGGKNNSKYVYLEF